MSRRALTASVFAHAVLILLLFSITFPQTARQVRFHLTPVFVPETPGPAPLSRKPVVRPRSITRPVLQSVPPPDIVVRQTLPEPPAALPPAALPPAALPSAPAPAIEAPREIAPPAVVASASPPPKPAVQTGSFHAAPVPPVQKPALAQPKVASAGFGGPAAMTAEAASPPRTASVGVFGESTAPAAPARQSNATAPGGFGSAVAATAQSPARQALATAQFDAVVVKTGDALPGAKAVVAGRFTPLEILEKPRPVYSEEARRLQIEGEVVLEALFSASGRIRVTRVMRSLGHGLDENAIQAAARIRYRPATENGSPRDMLAVVRIAFQLAY